MPWQLVPLHASGERVVALPQDVSASVGRRPANDIVCRDLAVSGQHCIFHCRGAVESEPPDVEDCSTNGTYINDAKLSKGQRRRLASGDIISLTKGAEEDVSGTAVVTVRIQFRLEFNSEIGGTAGGVAEQPVQSAEGPGGEVPPTAPDRHAQVAAEPSTTAWSSRLAAPELPRGKSERSFAQDLLVHEQQSKAMITGELLLAQRKLEEERQAVAAATRELKKIRQQVEEERGRRQESEEGRDRSKNEVEALRSDRKQLQELQTSHDDLKQRHEKADSELQTRLRKCVHLESAQEQTRLEVERATEVQRKTSQQQAELQARIRQAQERADRLEQQLGETKRSTNRILEEKARLEGELVGARESRRSLEQQLTEVAEKVAEAESGERTARESLDVAIARRAELECQASGAQADAEAARYAARQAQQRFSSSQSLSERLQNVGRGLSQELRRRAEIWDRALASGDVEALNDLNFGGNEGPTFAQVTCRRDDGDTPAKASQHSQGGAHQQEAGGSPERGNVAEVGANVAATPSLAAPSPAASSRAARDRSPAAPSPSPLQEAAAAGSQTEAREEKEDSLLVAVALAGGGGEGEERRDGAGRHEDLGGFALGGGSSVNKEATPEALRLPGGCSTAWSLEVLDLADANPPPSKRFRAD